MASVVATIVRKDKDFGMDQISAVLILPGTEFIFLVVQPLCTKSPSNIRNFVDDPHMLLGNKYKTLQVDMETCLQSLMAKNP